MSRAGEPARFQVERIDVPGIKVVGAIVVQLEQVAGGCHALATAGTMHEADQSAAGIESCDQKFVAEDKAVVDAPDARAAARGLSGNGGGERCRADKTQLSIGFEDLPAAKTDG